MAKYAFTLKVGTQVSVVGRFQSREYIKEIDGEAFTRTTYEVSASRVEVV